MESLKILIRNLAFIILLATFLELLLPNKSMRGFVQLVMGLFVISAILGPVSDLLKIDLTAEIPAWVSTSSRDLPVLAAEDDQKVVQSAVKEQYLRILKTQVKSLLSTIEGVKEPVIEIELGHEDTGTFTDYPEIKKIKISYNKQTGVVRPVEPVIINGDSKEVSESETPKEREIREKVAAIMQIPEERIVVEEDY